MPQPQEATGGVEPDMGQIDMRRRSNGSPEQADKPEHGHSCRRRKLAEQQRFGEASMDEFDRFARNRPVAGGRLHSYSCTSMTTKQTVTGTYQKLLSMKWIRSGLEGPMERPETAHQIGIVNYVLGEVWDLFDSEAMRHS